MTGMFFTFGSVAYLLQSVRQPSSTLSNVRIAEVSFTPSSEKKDLDDKGRSHETPHFRRPLRHLR